MAIRREVPTALKPVEFSAHGPYLVPVDRDGTFVDKDGLPEFWNQAGAVSTGCGCYVFSVRTSQGAFRPIYVGKTKGPFSAPGGVFKPGTIVKLKEGMPRHGTMHLFLVKYERPSGARGSDPASTFLELERLLIQLSWKENPHLINIQGRPDKVIRIKRVLDSTMGDGRQGERGRSTSGEQTFRKMLGLRVSPPDRQRVESDGKQARAIPPVPTQVAQPFTL